MVKLSSTATQFALSPTLASNEFAKRQLAAGKTVLHAGFGESPFPVPPRLQTALEDGAHRKEYLPTAGEKPLLDAALSHQAARAGLDVSKFDALAAPGSKLILFAIQLAVAGDLVLPNPSWVSYSPQATMAQTSTIWVQTKLDDEGYHIDPNVLRETLHKARAEGKNPSKIILNFPNNPSGLMMPESEMAEIAKVCVEEDLLIISDEIYGRVRFDGKDTNCKSGYRSFAHYAPDNTVVTTGLSKHLSLGGWRLGVCFVPKAIPGLHGLMANIASETWSCVPAPITEASVVAYEGHEDVEEHIRKCSEIHGLMTRYIAEGLRGAGITSAWPSGAFYNYPDFDPIREGLAKLGVTTSIELAAYLRENYSLLTLPSTAFGGAPEELKLRLSSCDYNGAKVLEAALKDGVSLDVQFIKDHAPNLILQVEVYHQLADKCRRLATEK